MSSVLRPSQHIFPDYIRLYLETSIRDFKFSEAHAFEKARLIGLELCRKRGNELKSFSINKRNLNSIKYF